MILINKSGGESQWSILKAEMFDDLHFCLQVYLRPKIDQSS